MVVRNLGVISREMLTPWRMSVATPRGVELLQAKQFTARTIRALAQLDRQGILVTLVDQEDYPRIEAKLSNGTIVILNGFNPQVAKALLTSKTLQNLPLVIKTRIDVDVSVIHVNVAAESSVYYLFDNPIEIRLKVRTGNGNEMRHLQADLLKQLVYKDSWPSPVIWDPRQGNLISTLQVG